MDTRKRDNQYTGSILVIMLKIDMKKIVLVMLTKNYKIVNKLKRRYVFKKSTVTLVLVC